MSRWSTFFEIALISSMVAVLGTRLAVLDARIGPGAGAWLTLAVFAMAALVLALRRQSQERRSVGQILDDVENSLGARPAWVRR